MGIKVTGNFDDLSKRLNQMQKNAEALDGKHEVPLSELFNSSFMRKYTNFSSFDELLGAGGWEVNSKADFAAIPDDAFDQHIKSTTHFDDWAAMKNEAAGAYALRKLGF